jgi:hypothetical protein
MKLRDKLAECEHQLVKERAYAQLHRLMVIDLANGTEPALDIQVQDAVRIRLFRASTIAPAILITSGDYHEVTTPERFRREWLDTSEGRAAHDRILECIDDAGKVL